MAYLPAYPVNFESGGDTVSEAFGKHIEEFKNVYDILTAHKQRNDTADTEISGLKTCDIDGGRITGTLDISHITGDLDGSRITGNVAGSRITGDIPNATIAAGKVTGLDEHVRELLPEELPASKLIEDLATSANGYIKFGGGVIVNWGSVVITAGEMSGETEYKKPYPIKCFIVLLSAGYNVPITEGELWRNSVKVTYDNSGSAMDKTIYYLSLGV